MYCKACRNMIVGDTIFSGKSWQGAHHETAQDLIEASKWCIICSELGFAEQYEQLDPSWLDRRPATKFGAAFDGPKLLRATNLEHRIHWLPGVDGDGNGELKDMARFCRGYSYPKHREEPIINHEKEPLDTNTGSPKVMHWIKGLLDKCDTEKHHTLCRAEHSSDLPTRLVDLLDNTHPGSFRIIHTNTEDMKDTRYTTLSYCWGGAKFTTLTASTMPKLTGEINSLDSVPRTWREAASVIKALGFRYVWIDALCILQDSEKDWEQEASRMGLYYRHSSLNIIAAMARNPHDGLFRTRDVSQILPLKFRFAGPGEHNFLMPGASYFSRVQKSFITSSRGWVLQELFLAHRCLLFGEDQVFWECRRHVACEVFPTGVPFDFVSGSMTSVRSYVGGIAHSGERLEDKPFDAAETSWKALIMHYTSCNLTFAKDRLPALAGIADYLKTLRGDTYLAGLWGSNLALDMCWYIGPQRRSGATAVQQAMPSWSWASFEAPAHFEYNGDPFARILDAKVTTSERMPLGSALGGSILLRTIVLTGRVLGVEPKGPREAALAKELTVEMDSHEIKVQTYFDHETDVPSAGDELTFVVLVNNDGPYHGLLVSKMTGQDAYARIAYFQGMKFWEGFMTSGESADLEALRGPASGFVRDICLV